MASPRSAMALSKSFLAQAMPRVAVERGSFGSSRIASLQSAMALSYSFAESRALPRLL